jgi:hypothetical protein
MKTTLVYAALLAWVCSNGMAGETSSTVSTQRPAVKVSKTTASRTSGSAEDERTMTREERISAHHARIGAIIQENRAKQMEAQEAARAAGQRQ